MELGSTGSGADRSLSGRSVCGDDLGAGTEACENKALRNSQHIKIDYNKEQNCFYFLLASILIEQLKNCQANSN